MIDDLVADLRGQVTNLLSQEASRFDSDLERAEFARAEIHSLLDQHWISEATNEDTRLSEEDEQEVVESVLAHMFGLGRLQRYINDDEVENIDVNGCDVVWVSYSDGSKILVDPVCDNDEELISLIRLAGARLGLAERRFDSAHPELDLRLPDGTRLSAVMSVCERPSLSLRRHRYVDLDLDDLVELEMIDQSVASLLRAAVLARKNLIISGAMNSGKTTLLRGLASCIPPEERIVTIEQALELGLNRLSSRHPNSIALEAREANIEGEGEIGMSRLVRRSLRMNADRVIVGEVLGDEVIPMLNAMSQGRSGSMCTIHSNSSNGVFRRIASYAAQAPERLGLEATNLLIAGSIDFVIFIDTIQEVVFENGPSMYFGESSNWNDQLISPIQRERPFEYPPEAATCAPRMIRKVRRVTSIREVIDAEGSQIISNEIWKPSKDGRAIVGTPLQHKTASELREFGFEADF